MQQELIQHCKSTTLQLKKLLGKYIFHRECPSFFWFSCYSLALPLFPSLPWKWSIWTIQNMDIWAPWNLKESFWALGMLWSSAEVHLEVCELSWARPLFFPLCQRLRQAAWRTSTPDLVRSWVRDIWPMASSGFGDWEFFCCLYWYMLYLRKAPCPSHRFLGLPVCKRQPSQPPQPPCYLNPFSSISPPSAVLPVLTHQLCLASGKLLLAKKHLLIWCWPWISCDFHPWPWTFLFAIWKWV